MAPRHFTKVEARAAAQRAPERSGARVTASTVLSEAMESLKEEESFDVFLSHAAVDAELVLGVKQMLEEMGAKVYVDWVTDDQLDRSAVNAKTAELLRRRMKQSISLLYLATSAASSSTWMPWELGFFDGHQSGGVAILPLLDDEADHFSGQEYLGLYPRVTKDTYKNGGHDVFVEGLGRWKTLKEFLAGNPIWRKYSP